MFTSIEEWIRQVIDQLAVGQDVYLAPASAPILPAREIHLEKAFISEIPATGNTIHIKKADGEVQIVDVDARSTAYLYLGTVDIDGKIQSWVFLSKEKFWAWWEWVILTDELNPYVNFRQGSVDETPTLKNLQISRLIADALINDNLRYQNMECIAYEKRPYIEKFVKAGLSCLAKEYVKGQHKYGYGAPLSIQESSLTKLLGIDGQGLKRLRQNDGGGDFLNWLQYEKTSGQEIPDHTISWLCKEGITPRDLKFTYGKMSITQIHHYIVQQMKESQMSSHSVITWTDYLSMAKGLHMDTDSELIYRVRDLKRRHNELVQSCQKYGSSMAIRVGKILEEYPHVDEICQSLKEKYEYNGEDT